MTRPELEWAALPIVERSFQVRQQALAAAGVGATDLDRVILVGGGARECASWLERSSSSSRPVPGGPHQPRRGRRSRCGDPSGAARSHPRPTGRLRRSGPCRRAGLDRCTAFVRGLFLAGRGALELPIVRGREGTRGRCTESAARRAGGPDPPRDTVTKARAAISLSPGCSLEAAGLRTAAAASTSARTCMRRPDQAAAGWRPGQHCRSPPLAEVTAAPRTSAKTPVARGRGAGSRRGRRPPSSPIARVRRPRVARRCSSTSRR